MRERDDRRGNGPRRATFGRYAAVGCAALAAGCSGGQSWVGDSPRAGGLEPTTSPSLGTLARDAPPASFAGRIALTAARPGPARPDPTKPDLAQPERADGNDEIFSVDPAGGNLLRHTDTTAADREPDWKPDYSRLVVTRTRQAGRPEGSFVLNPANRERADLYLLNPDGTGAELPATLTPEERRTPESRRAALEASRKRPLWKAEDFKDGERTGASVAYPRFSPDGLVLVVVVMMDDGSTRLFLADAEGRGTPRKLTDFGGPASWRPPDGRQLVFSGRKTGDRAERLYVVAATGGDPKALTDATPVTREDVEAVLGAGALGGVPLSPLIAPAYFADTLPAYDPQGNSVVFSRAATTVFVAAGPTPGPTPAPRRAASRLPRLLRLRVAPAADDPNGLVAPVKEGDAALPPEVLTQETAETPVGETREDAAATFSASGDRLLFTRRASSGGILHVLDLNTGVATPFDLKADGLTLFVGAASWR